MSTRPAEKSRFRGVLLGAAVGDAFGAQYEHQPAGELINVKFEAYGHGIYGHEPGGSTDDSTLTGFHADAWIESDGDEPYMHELYVKKLIEWYNGNPKDMGRQTHSAISSYIAGLAVKDSGSCGNGSLMAVSPSGLMGHSPQSAGKLGYRFSGNTHPNELCRYVCGQFAADIYMLSRNYDRSWTKAISIPVWMPIDGASQGYVAIAAGIAYAHLELSKNMSAFESLCSVVRLGGDTDTNASITGALLGAAYGDNIWQFPTWLLNDLVDYDLWIERADALYELAMK